MESLESQIMKYGERKELAKVTELVKETDIHTIYTHIDKLILLQKFVKYLQYVFNACQVDESWAHKKKGKIIIYCLKQIQQKHQTINKEILDQIVYKIQENIQVLCFKPEHLDKICTLLLSFIDKGCVGETSWMNILPEILRKMCAYEKVEYQDELISTDMYNTAIVKKILALPWRNDLIISIGSMFLKIKLTPEENQILLRKITGSFATLDPSTIPPLVYQLLQLNITDDSNILFLELQRYFGSAIYIHGSFVGSVYSESIGTDVSTDSFRKLVETERTTLYHIFNAFDTHSVKQYIKYLSNSNKLPENILHPFNLTLLIMCSTEPRRGNNISDVIKSAMLRYFIEEDKREKFYFKENVPSRFSVTLCLKQIIDISSRNRDVTIDGLIELAFLLLQSMPPLGKEAYYERLYKIANFILVGIIEKDTNKVKRIMTHIGNCLKDPRFAPQTIECFTIIGSRFAYATLQNISSIMLCFENVLSGSNSHVSSFLEVIINLVRHCPKDMMYLMSQLEQLLSSSHYEKRLNIVTAYIKLIKHLKINSAACLSQRSGDSLYSLSTQMSLSRLPQGATCAFTNEAICLDVMNKLQHARYCMHPDMKQHLYKGLPDVADKNIELGVPILQVLLKTFSEFKDDDNLPPLTFNKTCEVVDNELKIVDSISQMTMAISLMLNKLKENSTIDEIMFDGIAEKMITCDVEHFTKNQDVDLVMDTADAQQELYIVCEAMATYEALMTYYILSWDNESGENHPKKIKGLFKGYKRLADYLKQYGKGKKANKKNSTIQTQSNSSNGTRSLNKLKLKLPNSIMPLECFDKIVELLYCEDVQWCSTDDANILKSQISFHIYILESLIPIIHNCTQIKHKLTSNANYYKQHFTSLGNTLYDRCVKRYKILLVFDTLVATQTLDTFYHLEVTKQQIKHMWEEEKNSQEIDETAVEDLRMLEELKERLLTVQALFDSLDMDDDPDTCKTVATVVNILGILIQELSTHIDLIDIINWLKQTCRNKGILPKSAANNFVVILLKASAIQSSSNVVIRLIERAISAVIGLRNEETPVQGDAMDTINEATATLILQTLLAEIKANLDDIDWIVGRIRQEYQYFTIVRGPCVENGHDEVKRKERNLCGKLTEIVNVLSHINQLNITNGTHTDLIIKTNIQLFNTMTNLGKYFFATSTANNLAFQNARFDGLVRTTGKLLFPVIYEYIDIIKQSPEDGTTFKRPTERTKARGSIPALILAQEHFKKALMQITKKTKVDIFKYVGIGKNSGFRLRDIKSALNEQNGDESMQMEESPDAAENTSVQVDSNVLDSDSVVPEVSTIPVTTLVEDSDPESDESSEDEEVIIPIKRNKRK